MAAALADRVETVLGGLAGDERAALERRERNEASYADIAAELDIRREQVADLLVGRGSGSPRSWMARRHRTG